MKERARSTHRTGAFLLGALAAMAAGAAACSLSQEGVTPPADTLFFPSYAVMPPTGQWLYVANSNADLRYNGGTLAMLNVGEDVAGDAGVLHGAASDRAHPGQWGVCPTENYVSPVSRSTPPTCCWDVLDSNILNCDERLYVQADATVRVGSFAAGMVFQPYCSGPCWTPPDSCPYDPDAGRIIMGVRGDTSITWVDVLPGAGAHPGLRCRQDGSTGSLVECTQKVTSMRPGFQSQADDKSLPDVQLPDEPYALTVDDARDLLYVGHLVGNTSTPDSGGISIFNVASGPTPTASGFPPEPAFITATSSPFPSNNGGNFGITDLTLHAPLGGDPAGATEIFASSRYVPLVTSMSPFLSGSDNATQFNCGGNSDVVLLGGPDSLSSGLSGSEMRGVAFYDPPPEAPNDAQRVFALQRVPPALVGFQVNKNAAGGTTVVPTSVIETCSGPTFLYRNGKGDRTRLYVNCFDTGEIYVFDPTLPSLLTSFQVGRGPAGMVFDPKLPVAYVLNFSQNDIVVVDVAPGSPTENHVIQRIGFPSTTPR